MIRKASARKRLIFGPATSLFVGHRPIGACSLLTPRGRPKTLVAPSAAIYEMASMIEALITNFPVHAARPEAEQSEQLEFFEKPLSGYPGEFSKTVRRRTPECAAIKIGL